MLSRLLFVTSIINELEQKLNDLAKNITDPGIGLIIFVILLIIGCTAVAGYSKR